MSEHGKRGYGVAVASVALLVVLPIFYLLSLGPVVRLANSGLVSDRVVNAMYAPLILCAERSAPANAALTTYVDWWDPPALSPPSAPLPDAPPPPLPPPDNFLLP